MLEARRSDVVAVSVRLSSVLLVVLALGVVISIAMVDEGVQRLGFTYLAGRWSNPLWQAWDLLLLWLAIGQSGYGMYRFITEHVNRSTTRLWLGFLVCGLSLCALALGTITILTFDPSFT